MGEGDCVLDEQGDAARHRHSRIGAQQDVSRALADLESAGAGGPDPEIAIRLEVIEQELTVLGRQAGSRARKRNERRVLDLLLSERLLLEQLGFATYAAYATWRDGDVTHDETDLAYLEFARMELDAAQERLDAIDAGEPDPHRDGSRSSRAGGLEPFLVVAAHDVEEFTVGSSEHHSDPLEPWTAEPTAPADATRPESRQRPTSADRDAALPHLGTTGIDDLDLPYWDETA